MRCNFDAFLVVCRHQADNSNTLWFCAHVLFTISSKNIEDIRRYECVPANRFIVPLSYMLLRVLLESAHKTYETLKIKSTGIFQMT